MSRRAVLVVLAASGAARAGGLAEDAGSPRAVGRAGVGTVGDDGGGALLVNPAAIARRDDTRAQVGVAVADDEVAWTPAIDGAPVARDQASSSVLPFAAVQTTIHCWIVGLTATTAAAAERSLASPNDLPEDNLGSGYEYRYAGFHGALRKDTVALGAARRLGDAVAIGASLAASRVALDETRSVWTAPVARPIGDPNHDFAIAISAAGYTPTAVVGVLVAPPDTRLELAASVGWTATARVSGDFSAAGPKPGVNGTMPPPPGAAVAIATPSAKLDLREPVTLRTGARWLAQRWIAEVDGDLWILPSSAKTATWQLGGLRAIDTISGDAVDVTALPSRVSAQTHGALRGAVDVELIAGFLWATAGYAYTTPGTATAYFSPTLGDLGGHTAALGLEISAGDFTISLGWARTWSPSRAQPAPVWQHDNPFVQAATDSPVQSGSYSGSRDLVGATVDVAF